MPLSGKPAAFASINSFAIFFVGIRLGCFLLFSSKCRSSCRLLAKSEGLLVLFYFGVPKDRPTSLWALGGKFLIAWTVFCCFFRMSAHWRRKIKRGNGEKCPFSRNQSASKIRFSMCVLRSCSTTNDMTKHAALGSHFKVREWYAPRPQCWPWQIDTANPNSKLGVENLESNVPVQIKSFEEFIHQGPMTRSFYCTKRDHVR